MFNLIKNLFSKNSKLEKKQNDYNEISINKDAIEQKFFNQMLNKNEYLCKEKKEEIFKVYKHQINLLDGTPLTKEEKQELGLNVRMKITKEYVELFNKNKIKEINPKDELQRFIASVISRVNAEISVLKCKNAGIQEMELCSAIGDCDWCRKLENKILPIDEVLELVKNPQCTCRYSLLTRPIIEFDEDN